MRLSLWLALLFVVVSFISLSATYLVVRDAQEQEIRVSLLQDMAGFRAAPTSAALAALVTAQAEETDPERRLLSYLLPSGRVAGNAFANTVRAGAGQAFRPRTNSTFANPKRQTIRAPKIMVMAGPAGDVAVAAQDLVVKKKLTKTRLIRIEGYEILCRYCLRHSRRRGQDTC